VRFLICALRGRIRVKAKSMVGLGGLEPPTSPLSGARSNHLSYRPDVIGRGGLFFKALDICRCLVWEPWVEV
jgi:hypothetical protein